jgi:hypothetical protein
MLTPAVLEQYEIYNEIVTIWLNGTIDWIRENTFSWFICGGWKFFAIIALLIFMWRIMKK